ncbi:hypothetical protein AX15_003977 [Amanita polypyramis BW_CC]|nr:hypothetical protein AX15_003977 [Amanita polypyramis BW_CC]
MCLIGTCQFDTNSCCHQHLHPWGTSCCHRLDHSRINFPSTASYVARSIVLLLYFFVLTFVTVAHCSDIWRGTVYKIHWFGIPSINRPLSNTVVKGEFHLDWTAYMDEVGSTAERKRKFAPMYDLEEAPWANDIKIHRGIDQPFFVNKGQVVTLYSSSKLAKPPAPTSPPPIHEKSVRNGSRFIEIIDESPKRAHRTPAAPTFSGTSYNQDLHLPLPGKSEWVPANVVAERNTYYRI